MNIKNGERYANNYARAAAYYLGTCAPKPQIAGRIAAYDLITGLYALIAEDSAGLGWKPSEDVTFGPWEQQRDRQKDVKAMRDPIGKIEALVAELFRVIDASAPCEKGLRLNDDARPKRTLVKALSRLGVALEGDTLLMTPECAEGLKALCEVSKRNVVPITDSQREDKQLLYFSRYVFDPSANWVALAFDRFLNADGEFLRLCDELEKRGYRRVDCKDGRKISLDYVKLRAKKDAPIKASWADKAHAGVEATYEDLRLEPCVLWLRMPMYKTALENMAAFASETKEFLMRHTKTCNGCRYCVQTDKTGARPLAAIKVDDKLKCPYYAAFGFNWRHLDRQLADTLLSALDTVDGMTL